jgi:hypothetical protein
LVATREVHQITVDRVVYDCTLSHLLESYLTPEQIAFAYSSPTPAAFKGRPHERKRQAPFLNSSVSPNHSNPHSPVRERQRGFPSSVNGIPPSNNLDCISLDEIANSSLLADSLFSHDTHHVSFSSRFNDHNQSFNSSTVSSAASSFFFKQHRRTSSNESSLLSIESVSDINDNSVMLAAPQPEKFEFKGLFCDIPRVDSPHSTVSDSMFDSPQSLSSLPISWAAVDNQTLPFPAFGSLDGRFDNQLFHQWN